MKRFLAAFVTLTALFTGLLWGSLALPPLFGCSSYSDRPGPGCFGYGPEWSLSAVAENAASLWSYAAFGALYYWAIALIAIGIAVATRRRPRNHWVRLGALAFALFLVLGYATAGLGWYMALGGVAILVIAAGGALVGSWLLLGWYPHLSEQPVSSDLVAATE